MDSTGDELAKVLWYYGLIPDVVSPVHKIVCPFHQDVNPSLMANLEDGSWYCFGCNLSGNAQRFVKLIEQAKDSCNDIVAYQRYLAILKSDKSNALVLGPRAKARKGSAKQFYDEAYDYYHGLHTTRWLDDAEVESDPDVLAALEYMERRGFNAMTLEECGAKVNYNSSYGLIFPMRDNGVFKGWVCRTMVPAVERKRKYLYNKGFSRATTLVGNYGPEDYVFVVEGYMDRLKLVQMGLDNVVAILGWKATSEQIAKLKRAGITKVISALDNDEYGKRGTRFLKHHFDVTRWKYLKGVKDPGDFTRDSFNRMFERTMESFGQQSERK